MLSRILRSEKTLQERNLDQAFVYHVYKSIAEWLPGYGCSIKVQKCATIGLCGL